MVIKLSNQASTAKGIIKQFNKNKINYGLARNYEKFPDFDHDINFFEQKSF
jgi:hypothetical protein